MMTTESESNMDTLRLLVQNKILVSALVGWIVAQVLKTLIYIYLNRKFVAERLVGSGGMPSSHSATVCALATSTVMQYGVGSFEFAITTIFAIVVMYDAIGVRRETGIQAKVLNEMIDVFAKMNKNLSVEDRLKEFVGHTPFQVLMGAILGVVLALIITG